MNTNDALNRRSRMARRATDKRMELTERDIAIFRLLDRYRYLRSTYIHALVGGKSRKRFVERLGDLYHEGGYLNRPAQQWQTINARYMPVVHELGGAGERVLAEHDLRNGTEPSPPRKKQNGANRQFHHELMICEIMSSLEIGVLASPNLRLISSEEILRKAPEATRTSSNPFAVPVSISHTIGGKICGWDKPLIPDALFGIEYRGEGQKKYRFFALEADRATEPIGRSNLEQSSYFRKILQYREMAAAAIYRSHWGLPNLFVLTVTTNERHAENMMELVNELTGGIGTTLFLFKTMPSLTSLERAPSPTPRMFREPWQRVGHDAFEIDKP